MYKVYKLTVPNGKAYIGITKQEKLYDRCQYGSGYDYNTAFYNDILEYGWKNVKQEVLEEVETKAEALTKEREYILKYQTFDKEHGYNSHINKSREKKEKTYIRNRATGELFPTLRAAAEAYGVTHEAIRKAIKNEGFCRYCRWDRVAEHDLISEKI